MADLISNIPAYGGFLSGDIMHAFSDLALLWRHTEIITDHRKEPGRFFKPIGGLAYERLLATSKWMFERINRTQIRRTLLSDMSNEILSRTPNAQGKSTNVPIYIASAISAGKRPMFGDANTAIWFEDPRFNMSIVSQFWTDKITPETGLAEADHKERKYSKHFLKNHLVMVVNDFSEIRRGLIESSDHNDDPFNPILFSKRKYKVDWRNLPGMSGQTILDLEDPTRVVETRRDIIRNEAAIVELKV